MCVRPLQPHDCRYVIPTALHDLLVPPLTFIDPDSVQEAFEEAGGIKPLLDVASNANEREDIRLKALSALFHLSMYKDSMRNKVSAAGLKTMADMLGQSKTEYRSLAAKTLVNISLSGTSTHLQLI